MKKYFRYSLALLVGGTLLGLIGCGSSDSNCSNGQVNSQFGCATSCGTNMVYQSGTSGACVANTLASGSGYSCQNGLSIQTIPSQDDGYFPQLAPYGYEVCCEPGFNLSTVMYPQQIEQYCQPPTTYSGTNQNGQPCPGEPGLYYYNGQCIQ